MPRTLDKGDRDALHQALKIAGRQTLPVTARSLTAPEVSAIDSFPSVTDAPERSLSLVARINIDLADVYLNTDMNEDGAIVQALERCKDVSLYLLERAGAWLGDSY